MVSFRKMSLAFAGCVLMGASVASASVPCTVAVDQQNLRAEALTQPIGPITVSCEIPVGWADPAPAAITATFQLVSDGFVFTNLKDDADKLADPTINVAAGGAVAGGGVISSDGKSVTWTEVNVFELVKASVGGETRTVVFGGLKINASALALLTNPKVRVNVITYGAATHRIVLSDATQEVGTVQDAVSFGFKNKQSINCSGATAPTADNIADADYVAAMPYVTFTAGYPGALAIGDKLKARFTVPAGTKLFVGTSAMLADGTFPTAAGGADPAVKLGANAAGKFVEVKAVDGLYEATWEITDEGGAKDTFRIPVYLVIPANSPAANTLTAKGSLAPWSDVATSTTDSEVDEPRYTEPTDFTDPIYSIISCNTLLLFPYATNVGNWDTGIAVTNPTADMKNADDKWASGNKTDPKTGQTGACTLYFVGDNAPAKAVKTTKSIAAGKTLAFTVGQGNEEYGIAAVPGFNGYVKVSCDFSFGKGFAFMSSSDLGGVGVGYVAQEGIALVP